MKKFVGYLMIILLFAGSVCGVVFGVKLLQANQQIDDLYTQEEVQEQYKEYINQISEKSIIIGQLNSKIEELNLKIENLSEDKENNLSQIEELQSEISTLEVQISEFESQILLLQNEITRLEGLLEGYEDIKSGTFELDFYVDETLFTTKVVRANNKLVAFDNPTKEFHEFKGWSINKTDIVDIFNMTITEDMTLYAVFEETYEWVELLEEPCILSQLMAGPVSPFSKHIGNGNGEFLDDFTNCAQFKIVGSLSDMLESDLGSVDFCIEDYKHHNFSLSSASKTVNYDIVFWKNSNIGFDISPDSTCNPKLTIISMMVYVPKAEI
mgnify:CR=1 FL=1